MPASAPVVEPRVAVASLAIAACVALGACATHAAGAVLDRHAAARARARFPGGRAGQAGALSRDLLRRAGGARTRASRLPALRGRADPRRQRARRHRQARRSRPVEATPGRGGGAPASDTNASNRGCSRPAPSRSTCASSGTTRCCSRSMRCRARRTTRARSATRSWPCRRRRARRVSCCRLFEGRSRHPRGGGHVSGDPEPRRGGGQRRRRGRRLGARERRRAVPGRPAAALSRRDLRFGRWRRRGEPAARNAQGVARAEPAAARVALLLARHVPAAGAHLLDSRPRATTSWPASTRATTAR